mmetsp:Transcript_47147/g.142752  ORF Transcript_47147/g.142752 Transcript_47147/m.142752 type:complete len:254 (-) Transcript_47147:172-933(-)
MLLLCTQIPPTEAGCRWDWRHARCEPFCDCSFQPRWGDFHLGRSCRQRKQFHTVDGKSKEIWWNGIGTCHIEPDTPYTKMSYSLIKGIRSTGKKLKLGTIRVGEKFTLKSRFGRARGDACTSWKDRAEEEGRELNDFQKKICSGKDVGNREKSSVSPDKYPNPPHTGVGVSNGRREVSNSKEAVEETPENDTSASADGVGGSIDKKKIFTQAEDERRTEQGAADVSNTEVDGEVDTGSRHIDEDVVDPPSPTE